MICSSVGIKKLVENYNVSTKKWIRPPGRIFCSDAKSIQLALDKYYYKWHSYPKENKIKKILISEFGKIPKYTRSNVNDFDYKRERYKNH
jgi:hypothetical protein